MGLRFQKRIPLIKGIALNISKSGISLTLGGRGVSINLGKQITGNIGLPSTGLSYRKRLNIWSKPTLTTVIFIIVLLATLGIYFYKM